MKVLLFHASAGQGHKKIAEVIQHALLQRGFSDEDVELIDALDLTSPLFKKTYPAVYYCAVRYIPSIWGWFYETLDHPAIYAPLRPLRSLYNRLEGGKLLKLVQEKQPALIVCTHFLSAELFATAKKKGQLQSKLVTVITDFRPHTFWVNEGTDYYWGMNDATKAELIERGVPADKIFDEGIPADPKFKPSGRKQEILKKWEMQPDRLTLLMTSGSFGLGPYVEVLQGLKAFEDKIQVFVVCGNNLEMKERLDRETYSYPVKIFGFVDFMDELMEASDLILTKPGGSTTVESLSKGTPMIVTHPIPGQETRNADYLKARHAAFFIETPDQIFPIIESALRYPELIPSKKKNIQQIAKPLAAEKIAEFLAGLCR